MFRIGIWTALATIVADQISKLLILDVILGPGRDPIMITGFFNIVLVWNRGVSFGLFGGDNPWMIWALVAVALVISVALVIWLSRVRERLSAVALGLLLGGALGNVVDRVRFGAVVDFLDLHWGAWHWPAFNLADAAITVGVVLLLWESLFGRDESPK